MFETTSHQKYTTAQCTYELCSRIRIGKVGQQRDYLFIQNEFFKFGDFKNV